MTHPEKYARPGVYLDTDRHDELAAERRRTSTEPRYADTEEFECSRCGHDGPMHVYHVPAPDVWYAVCPACDRSFEPE